MWNFPHFFFDRFPYRTNVKKLVSVLYFTVQWDCLHCASLCSVIASLCTEYRVSKWKRIPLLLDTLYFPRSFVIVITETVLPKHADGLIGGKLCYWTLNNEQLVYTKSSLHNHPPAPGVARLDQSQSQPARHLVTWLNASLWLVRCIPVSRLQGRNIKTSWHEKCVPRVPGRYLQTRN